jgi:hypothetical protein
VSAKLKYTNVKAWARAHQEEDEQRRAAFKRPGPKPGTTRRGTKAPADGKPAAFYVPINYDHAILPEPYRGYTDYFFNTMHWKRCCWKANAEGFVQLKSRYLTRVIPAKVWPVIWRTLVEHGVIELDRETAVGKKCRGYRVTDGYRQTRRVVCTDDVLSRKIQRVYAEEHLPLLPVHRWLRSKFDDLEFDWERARPIIATLKPDRGSGLGLAEYREQRTEYCQRIANKDYWFHHDRFGRVHTPVTALEKELRGCLSAKGEPLVGIDLANSQPLLLGIFARQYFGSRMARKRFLGKSFDGRRQPYCYQEVQKMACRADCPLPADLEAFLRTCEGGRFYESFMRERDRARGKDRFKKRFYRVLFGRNRSRSPYRNLLKEQFRGRYPSAARVLRALKRKNYRHSAHVLQNYEATLFIYVICGRIMRERPDVVLYTIHDSLLTTRDALDYVEAVIRDEFRKLGVTPKLRREEYP